MSTLPRTSTDDDLVQLLVQQIESTKVRHRQKMQTATDGPSSVEAERQEENPPKEKLKRVPNKRPTIPKNNEFYEVVVPNLSHEEFRKAFRMSRGSFDMLMEKISKKVRISNLEKKLMFTISLLSTRESFSCVGNRFGLAKSAAYHCFTDIIDGLVCLFKEHVVWPTDFEFADIEQGFKSKTGGLIPGIIGAIDSCHVQIKIPARYSIYHNRMKTYSVILQGVCDHQLVFRDVYVGAPGCLYADRVFRNSPLSKEIQTLTAEDFHIVGNANYPPMQNLVVPFLDEDMLSETQMQFNDCLAGAHATIAKAFRVLFVRFRRLTYLDTSKPELANRMVVACLVLHNHILLTDPDDDVEQLLQQNDDLEVFTETDDAAPELSEQYDEFNGQLKRNLLLSLFGFI